jgi:hypothetical protein
METKEAIEFLKNNIKCVTLPKTTDKTNKIINRIITLLERGEKFEEMWREFEIYIEGKSEALTNKIYMLWQKYFPKEE